MSNDCVHTTEVKVEHDHPSYDWYHKRKLVSV